MNLGFKKIEVLVDKEISDEKFTRVMVEPVEKGYGITLGNTLRRVMLTSMPGSSIIGVKIEGVSHELMSIPGTATDMVELITQLKKVKIDMEGTEDRTLKIKVKKNGPYSAKNIQTVKGVTIKTPDIHLFNSLGDKEFEVELYVRKFRGYVEAKDHTGVPEGYVMLDGVFSPIKKIGYEAKPMMVDEEFTHERLFIDVTTDGSMEAREAILLASKIARSHLDLFDEMTEKMTEYEVFEIERKERESIDSTTIEELNLSVRSTNALRNAGLKTVGELRKVSETELKDFKNMGITSVNEVKEKMKQLGVELGGY